MAYMDPTIDVSHSSTSIMNPFEDKTYNDLDDNSYDEDFEAYESDFDEAHIQQDNSDDDQPSEDETSMNSDGPAKQNQIVDIYQNQNKNHNDSELMDAIQHKKKSFEVEKNYETFKQDSKPTLNTKPSKIMINFEKAKKQAKNEQISGQLKNRGDQLLDMIQLDSISIDLFMQIPDSYEAYISAFGHSNSVQVSVQTNEDALSEATQTENPTLLSKWTQKPIHIIIRDGQLPSPEDYLGVGGDKYLLEDESQFNYLSVISNTGRLSKFLSSASQVMLSLLNDDTFFNKRPTVETENAETQGFLPASIDVGSNILPIIAARPVILICFCSSHPSIFLTGHGFPISDKESQIEPSISQLNDVSLLCLWSVQQPSAPQNILTACHTPTAVSFSPGKPVMVIAGLSDGSLASWDLREASTTHPISVSVDNIIWRLQPPSYLTACSIEDSFEGSEVVGLQTLDNLEENVTTDGSFQQRHSG